MFEAYLILPKVTSNVINDNTTIKIDGYKCQAQLDAEAMVICDIKGICGGGG